MIAARAREVGDDDTIRDFLPRRPIIHIRQVEAPTRPLAHVGADPPGVGIISKLRAHAAAGTHYMPAAGFANDVRAMCNRILGLWIYFPAAEEAEFDAYHTYSVPNYMDN